MKSNEDGDVEEEWPSSPYQVLQHISGEAFRVAGEAIQSVYLGSQPIPQHEWGHRRSRSEFVTSVNRSTYNFRKWKSQMQRALGWGSSSREQSWSSFFNPEVLANKKRQWYQCHSKTWDHKKNAEPASLLEHFIIVGLHPDVDLEAVEDAFARRKKWELEVQKSIVPNSKTAQYPGPSLPKLEPQTLFKYPPGKILPLRPKDLAAFCFPGGVEARILERTPSLNELVYGQVADDTIYGICIHIQEFVQRPPAIIGASSPVSRSIGKCKHFLVSAPRCYCVLTRAPFFELHYQMLNSVSIK